MLIFFKKTKRIVPLLLVLSTFFICQMAFADGFGTSKYATGTQQLVKDVFTWLTAVIIPVTAGCMIAYQQWKKKVADGDGQAVMEANKATKRIIVAAIIGETASTLVTLITSYYT
ncbi:hypothetical protein [Paenibacillus sp. 1P03SA]|uniref:hypothetical protein n=1 Tax=Paenibacillus sp. 1P03SA TaxID=3132294 RepID=UPI0039A10B9D